MNGERATMTVALRTPFEIGMFADAQPRMFPVTVLVPVRVAREGR
jgi:hypothetical protein